MSSCKAHCNGEQCGEASETGAYYGYCARHSRQERALYAYYKAKNSEYYHMDKSHKTRQKDHPEDMVKAHTILTAEICARKLHADWYFHNSPCDGHMEYLHSLHYDRGTLERAMLTFGFSIMNARGELD
ncbi:hypothetical protein M426DRAFT_25893 [Hypoxylon sp. CI-4A]|nr:hypothetical protein M426DRAFT_25893 [Hypoxylon sp. CI-4A]